MLSRYCKLVDGTWGIQSPVEHRPGDVVSVETKSGAVKRETIGAFVAANGFGYRYTIAAKAPAAPAVAIGDLAGVIALFDRARANLKFPKVVLDVPAVPAGVKVNVAGPNSKAPGTLNVSSKEPFGSNTWFGRITRDGVFQPSREATPAGLVDKLRAFAAAPAKVAAEFGRLHGVCCFCAIPLRDERSTAVGYGETCAGNYGLPWGAEKFSFAAEEVQ